jgi:hypothetical protein
MCLTLKCDFKQSGHKITTDNTVQLFNNLNNLKLFNPMVLATLYSNFLAGQKVKNGHEINFGNLEINY